ncbi:MAG: DUF4142 domain-containing protein [Rhizorhabdus sp.]|jgi:putative membrane protein|uniref:DUF4142 domain-containing protein n=1 Tax=Rhizorhabdus sp. TaxID=1968843 RepID=UPI001B6C3DCA|nr:DUF4142 domain-containing protein [Rhizorhabdus sp.]MBP8235721.1 DUF4142 domain-containing protein [Rhizorhabdus sp.]
MKRSIPILSAAVLTLALAGCGDKTKADAETAANQAEQALDSAGAMASNVALDAQQALSPTPAGQEFIDRMAKSDAYEIAAAKLAVTNASSQAVKDFAAEMIKAHTDSTARIKAAAATANPALTPNAELTADQQDDLADLGKKKGAEFDKDYVDDQVDAHEDAVVLLRDYSAKGDTPALRTVAGELLPTVQGHLDHARKLDQ